MKDWLYIFMLIVFEVGRIPFQTVCKRTMKTTEKIYGSILSLFWRLNTTLIGPLYNELKASYYSFFSLENFSNSFTSFFNISGVRL